MEPSKKSTEINAFINHMTGGDREANIRADRCIPPPIGCGGAATDFKDALSRKEFSISGLCQKCQDKIFR